MVALSPQDEFICFADERAADLFDLRAANVRLIRVEQSVSPTQAAAANGNRSPADMLRLTRAVWRERLSVFFCPSVYTYFPLPPGLAAVITVHDAIADRFPELTFPSRRARFFWRAKVFLALAQARLVLTVSDFAAREIAAVLRVAPGRIRVAVEAPAATYQPSESQADVVRLAAHVGLPPGARWFAYVGGFNPHKHVDVIVRAHAQVAREVSDPPHLLLVGATDGDVFHGAHASIHAAIEAGGVGHLVHWTGFVPDNDLRHLLSGAMALLLPSENEGFGLPAVEAAACGTPVIATTASPLPELLAGGGIFVQPRDQAALVAALRAMLADEPARVAMGTRARARASLLTWTRGAASALGALREAAA
jgi:alpha-1,3-rhamnosyl/mannosyltransferase